MDSENPSFSVTDNSDESDESEDEDEDDNDHVMYSSPRKSPQGGRSPQTIKGNAEHSTPGKSKAAKDRAIFSPSKVSFTFF